MQSAETQALEVALAACKCPIGWSWEYCRAGRASEARLAAVEWLLGAIFPRRAPAEFAALRTTQRLSLRLERTW